MAGLEAEREAGSEVAQRHGDQGIRLRVNSSGHSPRVRSPPGGGWWWGGQSQDTEPKVRPAAWHSNRPLPCRGAGVLISISGSLVFPV